MWKKFLFAVAAFYQQSCILLHWLHNVVKVHMFTCALLPWFIYLGHSKPQAVEVHITNCVLLTLLYASSVSLFCFCRSSQLRMCTFIQFWLPDWPFNLVDLMRLCTITIKLYTKVLPFSLDNFTKLGHTCRLLLAHFQHCVITVHYYRTYLEEENSRPEWCRLKI